MGVGFDRRVADVMSAARSFRSARGGTVAIATAVAMIFIVGCMALAVDLGAMYVERRQAQGAVDIAAVVAVSDIANA